MKLFLKGDRCFTEKCAIEKRNYAPGQHGKGGRIKTKLQGYGLQLREKQKVNIPSYQVEEGDLVSLASRAAKNAQVTASVEAVKGRGVPKWLELDAAGMKGRVLSMPARDDVNFPIQEQLIVELYSK